MKRDIASFVRMAAQAGAAELSRTACGYTAVVSAVNAYSADAAEGGNNVQNGLNVTSLSITPKCLTTIGPSSNRTTKQCFGAGEADGTCTAAVSGASPGGCNAIAVQHQFYAYSCGRLPAMSHECSTLRGPAPLWCS
jgi:hypothetical protein